MSLSYNTGQENPLISLLSTKPKAVILSSSTWLAPAGIDKVFVAVIGGGGGGAMGNTGAGSGGGGGGAVVLGYVHVEPEESYFAQIGKGGFPGNTSALNNNGKVGGFTKFNNIIAYGGLGGRQGSGTSTASGQGSGGNGGLGQGWVFYDKSALGVIEATDGQFNMGQDISTASSLYRGSMKVGLPGMSGTNSGGGGSGNSLSQFQQDVAQNPRGGAGITGGGQGALHGGTYFSAGMGGNGFLGQGQEPHGQYYYFGGNGGLGGGGGGAGGPTTYPGGQGGDGAVVIWY
jgi:hypothetical protein